MAGHSKFKNIMHRKGAQDAKKAKIFTKITREISAAVHEGGSVKPEDNPRLRAVLLKARQAEVPKDRIQKAISNTQHTPTVPMRYFCYGPGMIAMVIECMTDSKNRIASEMRLIFDKHNAKVESTEYLFTQMGCVKYQVPFTEAVELQGLEAEAVTVEREEDQVVFLFAIDTFNERKKLLEGLGEQTFDGLVWVPNATRAVSEENAAKLSKFLEALEDHDDVQDIWTNAE